MFFFDAPYGDCETILYFRKNVYIQLLGPIVHAPYGPRAKNKLQKVH